MASKLGTFTHSPLSAARMASANPSPPSAIGATSTTASGNTERNPRWMARAAASAESEPLNLSGAMRTRIGVFSAGCLENPQARTRHADALESQHARKEIAALLRFRSIEDLNRVTVLGDFPIRKKRDQIADTTGKSHRVGH